MTRTPRWVSVSSSPSSARRRRFAVSRRGRAGHLLEDDVDGELARHFTRCGSAHAVAHAEDGSVGADGERAIGFEQAPRLLREVGDEEVVLVVLADLSDVGAPEQAYTNARARIGVAVHQLLDPVPKSSRNRCWPILT